MKVPMPVASGAIPASARVPKRLWPVLGIILLLSGSPLHTAAQDDEERPVRSDATALQIADLHLQARGGRDALAGLESLHRVGMIKEGKREWNIEWQWLRDVGVREDRRREHLGRPYHRLRARAGTMLWGHDVAPDRTEPGILATADSRAFTWDATLFVEPQRPFLEGTAYGHIFTYEGKRTLRDRAGYVVRVDFPDQRVVRYVIDEESFLLLGMQYEVPFSGRPHWIWAVPNGAARIGGVIFETGFDYYVDGRRFREVRFTRDRANEPLDQAVFLKPYVGHHILRPRS